MRSSLGSHTLKTFREVGRAAPKVGRNLVSGGKAKTCSRELPLDGLSLMGRFPSLIISFSHSGFTNCAAEIRDVAMDALARNCGIRWCVTLGWEVWTMLIPAKEVRE